MYYLNLSPYAQALDLAYGTSEERIADKCAQKDESSGASGGSSMWRWGGQEVESDYEDSGGEMEVNDDGDDEEGELMPGGQLQQQLHMLQLFVQQVSLYIMHIVHFILALIRG